MRLIDDLLDMSRIMRGRIELRRETVELSEIVTRSVEAVGGMTESRQQDMQVIVPEDPIWLYVDPVRLVQVLVNLLTNASKYNEVGGCIEVTAECHKTEAIIRVRDTGIGIEPELLPDIFELFTQSSRSLDRADGGLGIGLSLAKQLVEMHEGRITAESAGVGHGSTFIVALPSVEAPVGPAEHGEQQPAACGRRVLVVDDSVGAARMLAMLLSSLGGHEVEVAHDGPSALMKIRQVRPEIVFLDIGLPGMDGYQVAKRLRQDREFEELHDLLLIALTGYGQEEDRRRSKEAGFDEHLVKPPSADQIKKILSHPKLPSATCNEGATESESNCGPRPIP